MDQFTLNYIIICMILISIISLYNNQADQSINETYINIDSNNTINTIVDDTNNNTKNNNNMQYMFIDKNNIKNNTKQQIKYETTFTPLFVNQKEIPYAMDAIKPKPLYVLNNDDYYLKNVYCTKYLPNWINH